MDNAVISSIDGTPQSYPRPPARVAPPRHPGLRPRKKVRCTFDAGTIVCTPCERRGAECIGQHLQPSDHCDSQGQSANYENLSRSLVQVEALVSDLLSHESEGSLPNEAPFKPRAIRPKLSDRLSSSSSDLSDSSSHLNEPYSAFKDCTSHVFGDPREETPHDGRPQQSSQKNALAPSMNEYSHLSHSLLSVMPPPGTTRAILRKAGYADLLIQMIRKTYEECPEFSVQGQPLASFDIPNPTAHPISIARNLLLIALSLQIREEVAPSSSKKMVLSQSTKEFSHRYFNAATRNVTSKDQLVTSPEELETLMLEGLYQITSGNLQLG
ncbi:hypothetical protein BHE90_000752 [Fusarium euwallaceae]|uniref:Zn(2)-C6 fungal-type domain-containing protein n=1 Tax=Fusarium euwallaceae TaxID=1147111 RepID=A0A430M9T4_9HYPO|nr:hypothetical protein BHE90_000752 [Fusarium euwallaceae]